MKLTLIFLFAQLASVPLFGALRIDAVICNASGVLVEVFYVSGELDERIKPGESQQIVYPPSSEFLPISFDSKQYRFPCRIPPAGFMKVGMFKRTFKLVIGDDQRLYLVPFETSQTEALATAKKQTQPDGWPLEGVPAK